MRCEFDIVGNTGEFVRLNCRHCGRPVVVPIAYDLNGLSRRCTSEQEVERFPYVFTQRRRSIHPWKVYYLTEREANKVGVPGEQLTVDGSMVGSRLKSMIRWWGYKTSADCACEQLRNMLDAAPIAFIRRHRNEIAEQIVQSAQKMEHTVPHRVARAALNTAIRLEQVRLYGKQVFLR